MRSRVTAGMLVVVAWATIGHATAATTDASFDEAREDVESLTEELDEISTSCERNERRAETLGEQVEATLVSVTAAEIAVDRLERAVEETEARKAVQERERDAILAGLKDNVRELYMQGVRAPGLLSLLRAEDADEALARAGLINAMKFVDVVKVEELSATIAEIDATEQLLSQQKEARDAALTEEQALLTELQTTRERYEDKVERCTGQIVQLESELEIAEADERRLAAAVSDAELAISVPREVSAGGWTWPANGALTSGFGYRWGRLHAGIDVAAPTGTPIYAAKGGVVVLAGWEGGYGNTVILSHGGGMTTRYAHQSAIAVSRGQTVAAGERLGSMGSTGNSTGPHLHFEVRINDQPQNPIYYLP